MLLIEEDIKDDSGNVINKAGDLSVNIGDGLTITKDGKITTTSDLSGSNWKSLYRFTNGFIVNGEVDETTGEVSTSVGYFFERKSNGNLLYKNGDREIIIASYDTTMPEYEGITTEEGDDNAV